SVGEVTRCFLYHISDLDLSLGVLPFAALLVLALGSRGLPRPERIFVAATAAVSFWLVLEVAAFASEQSFRVEERNMFYVAPLFLVALLLWIERGAPRPALPVAASLVAAVALPVALPYSKLIGLPAVSDTPALLPFASLHDSGVPLHDMRWIVLGAAAVGAVLFAFVPA